MESEKKKRIYNTISKLSVIIIFIAIVVVLIAKFATDEEFRSFVNVKILRKEISEEGLKEIKLDADTNPTVYAYNKYIVVFGKNKLLEYTSDGKLVAELTINISVPIVCINDKYMIIAENNGKQVYMIYGENIVWNGTVEGNITGVNVNKNGYASIIIKNTIYKSVIAFYDIDGSELFRNYIYSNYAICTSISTNNKYLAVGEVDYSGTIIKSFVKIISIDKAQNDPENSIVYNYESENGQIITNINYQDKENVICMFSNYIQKIGIDSNERIYEINNNDLFIDINLNDAIAIIDKQSSGLFSYEYEMKIKSTKGITENLYILDSDLPKSLSSNGDNIALNFGNEVQIINSKGWLLKKFTSNNQIKEIVVGNEIAGVIYKNRIEIINL